MKCTAQWYKITFPGATAFPITHVLSGEAFRLAGLKSHNLCRRQGGVQQKMALERITFLPAFEEDLDFFSDRYLFLEEPLSECGLLSVVCKCILMPVMCS